MGGAVLGGRYEVGELLGHGGVGEVRAGHDRRLGRQVAVKLLRPEMAQMPGVSQRFENEARMAARLVHPHIVAVFDYGTERGVPYLVMERLSGRTLADVLTEGGPLGFGEAQELGMQVLDAVSAAHKAKMLHRDIKPGNILVCGPGCWKVGDFGIAKSIERSAEPALTSVGLVVGTPGYLPPERLTGGAATAATDIYGVGAVMYQSLSGMPPIDPGVPLAALANTMPRPLDEMRLGVPPRLAAVVTRAMARDPAARFASAAQMASALRDDFVMGVAKTVAFDESAPPARTEVMLDPIGRSRGCGGAGFVRSHRYLVAAVAAGVVVLVASLALLLTGGHANTSQTSATSPTTAIASPTLSQTTGTVPPNIDAALHRLTNAVRP
jgi:serine/threonine protein kinase